MRHDANRSTERVRAPRLVGVRPPLLVGVVVRASISVVAAAASLTAALAAAAFSPTATAAAVILHEAFDRPLGPNGLPRGWSLGPDAHVPYLTTRTEFETYGVAAPALRMELAPQTLNYRLSSPVMTIARMSAEHTVEFSLLVDQPDSPFAVEVFCYDSEFRVIPGAVLLDLLGTQNDQLRRYRISFRPGQTDAPGYLRIFFGLAYAKLFRAGSFILDDFEFREGRETASLDVYVTPTSVEPGEELALHISAGSSTAEARFYREAASAIRMEPPIPLTGLSEYPIPLDAYADGARWPAAHRIVIPATWPSGAYRVEVDDGDQIVHASFVVRASANAAASPPILVVIPNHTTAAYNAWGGRSLYSSDYTSRVSLARPLDSPVLDLYVAPIHLLRFLSREGLSFDVANDDDLHARPDYVAAHDVLVLPGHNEYWTREMRTMAEGHMLLGGAVVNLGGNTCWWQTRVESGPGPEDASVVCFKYGSDNDPAWGFDPSRVTTHWDSPPLLEPTTELLGISWREGGMVNWSASSSCPCDYDWLLGHGGYTVDRPEHWAFAGTTLGRGETFGRAAAIVGYEVDGALVHWVDGRPEVTGEDGAPTDLEVLGHASCFNQYRADTTGVALMVARESPTGWFFNGGTTGWCWGLAADPDVQQVTRNVLERAAQRERARGAEPSAAWQVSPNPTSDAVLLVGESAIPAKAVLFFDAGGRAVAETPTTQLGGNRFLARWDFRDRSGRLLPAGVYWGKSGAAAPVRVVRVTR